MSQGPTEIIIGEGATEIIVGGRPYKVPGTIVAYDEIVDIWNKIHEPENIHIVGTPGIDFENAPKRPNSALFPGETLEVQDGTIFKVDPQHVS